MKRNFLSKMALCIGAAITLGSCSIDDDNYYQGTPTPTAGYGVIVNASPNSGDLFFYADANLVNQSALGYTGANGYYNFYPGSRALSVRNAVGEIFATDTVNVVAGQYFSTFAVNTFQNIELVTYTDSLRIPESGRALVRFINLSPDATDIDVSTTTATLASGLSFKESSQFTEITGGTYDLTFKNTATGDTLFTDTAVNLYAGRIYTIYTKGFVTPTAGSNDTFSTELLRNY